MMAAALLLCATLNPCGTGSLLPVSAQVGGNPGEHWQQAASATHRTYHVDAVDGDDARDGLSPATAWRRLDKVSAAPLEPGDTVLFRRGGVWRGQLTPHSGADGAPITYAAYGEGAKPLLLGSAERSRPEDWQPAGDGVWVTGRVPERAWQPQPGFTGLTWGLHTEAGAEATRAISSEPPIHTITCVHPGTATNHIQLITSGLGIRAGECYLLRFRARCTKPVKLPLVQLMKRDAPWSNYSFTPMPVLSLGTDWSELALRWLAAATDPEARITFYLGGALPAGAVLEVQPLSLAAAPAGNLAELAVDVGNLVFDDGAGTGWKKWGPDELKQPGDYWYDAANWELRLCSPANPATLHRRIELALARHIVNQGGRHHVVYDGLHVSCGAAHGFGGGSTHHLTIRNCDVSWIGGAHQFTTPDGHPVRYGNGIEFWADAHDNLVERCRLWEIYDAALTNQGGDNNVEENLTWRDNVIWHAEYSFEYWNREGSKTRNVVFEHNTCVDAGFGWAHAQRPDPNGRHLMFYHNQAETTGFVVRDNVFCHATDSLLRMDNDWRSGLTMDGNVWWQAGPVAWWFLKERWGAGQFGEYQRVTGMDAGSVVAEPRFRGAAGHDYQLVEGTAGARPAE